MCLYESYAAAFRLKPEAAPSVHESVWGRRLVTAATVFVIVLLSFAAGLFYSQIVSQGRPLQGPDGFSGLIVDYVSINGPAINGGTYPSYCCGGCSEINGFGMDRLDALNKLNPPIITCSFHIGANTSGYFWVIVYNTDWDITYRASFDMTSSDRTVTFVSTPACGNACYVDPVASQWFKLGFTASAEHNPSETVTISITVKGYAY